MASLETAERIGGVGLLGVPTFDFFVWALDNYARGELLMGLREQLPPWLLNPAFVFVCMCAGLALLYLSNQRQLQRIIARPSPLVDVDQYRRKEHPGWLGPLLWVAAVALVAAPVMALAYTLAYKGTVPLQAHIKAPSICKTIECWPNKVRHRSAPQPIISVGHFQQTGTNNIAQFGNNNQASIDTGRRLKNEDREILISKLTGLKANVGFGAILAVPDAYLYASDLRDAFKAAGLGANGDMIQPMIFGSGSWTGIEVTWHGEAQGSSVAVLNTSDQGRILSALDAAHLGPINAHVGPEQPDGIIKIVVGLKPPSP